MRSSSITISALTAVALATFSLSALHAEWTDDPGAIALSGHVRSADEARWKACWSAPGLTVRRSRRPSSATRRGNSVSAARLGPGHYALRIRAAGYDLQGPAAVAVGARRAIADLTLRKTKDLAPNSPTRSGWRAFQGRRLRRDSCLVAPTATPWSACSDRRTRGGVRQGARTDGELREPELSAASQLRVSAPNLVRRFGAGTSTWPHTSRAST